MHIGKMDRGLAVCIKHDGGGGVSVVILLS
jgi:hypothetical protein